MTDSSKVSGAERPAAFPGSFKYTPLERLRELYVGFLQGLFHAAPPGNYHWDEDPNATEIIIQDESPVKEEVLQRRPLIAITRGPLQFYSLGQDDMMQYDSAIDRKTKGILVPGTMTLNCCSRTSLEAENIAWVAAEHIWLLRDLFMKHGMFDTGRQIQIGSPSSAGSIIADDNGDTWVSVAVAVPFQFPRMSSFTPLGKDIVNSITNRIATRFPNITNLGPTAVGSADRPAYVAVGEVPPIIYAPDARGGTAVYPDGSGFFDPNKTSNPDSPGYLPKQRHPLDPAREVTVRTVRPYRPGNR